MFPFSSSGPGSLDGPAMRGPDGTFVDIYFVIVLFFHSGQQKTFQNAKTSRQIIIKPESGHSWGW